MVAQTQQANIRDTLNVIPLFSGFRPRLLGRLTKACTVALLPTGTVLYQRGDHCAGLHVLLSGQVKLSLPAHDDDEKVVSLVRAGQSFGVAEMFLGTPRLLGADAIRPSHVLTVDRATVDAAASEDAQFARRLVETVSRQWRQLLASLESCTVHSGRQRVVGYLLDELVGPEQGGVTITLPAKKRIIASQLNLTHEHFSRILHELAADGLIQVHGREVAVQDSGRLRTLR